MAHRTGVVSCDGVALDIAAGGAAGVGGDGGIAVCHGITVHVGGIVRLPLNVGERQGPAAVLNALGDVLCILLGKIGIAALDGKLLCRTAVARRLDLHGVELQRERAHESVVRDELTLLRQQCQHGFHILFSALDRNMLRMLAALVFRKLLLQKVRQVVLEAVLLEIRAGNARRIVFRTQIIDFLQFCAIVVSDDGG